jgi:hypothetical protein
LVFILSCEKEITYDVKDIPTDFIPLAKPEEGKGHQVHINTFPVPSNFERELYVRLPIGNKEKIYVTEMEVKMRPGSHHFIAYPFRNENDPSNPKIGVMRDQNLASGRLNILSNNNMNGFILESTAPEYSIKLPKGYAIPFEANSTLDFNAHYFNKTKKTLFGEGYFNLYTKEKSEISGELEEVIIDNHENLTLPPNKVSVIETIYTFDKLTRYLVLTSHNHKAGQKFEMYGVGGKNDGKLLYTSTDYVHPIINYYNDEPLTFEKGDKMKMVVTYKNSTSRTISFGVTSEDEMGIAFGYSIKN